jgi:hypothetical protein
LGRRLLETIQRRCSSAASWRQSDGYLITSPIRVIVSPIRVITMH